MKISKAVEIAVLKFMKTLEDLRPDMRLAQQALFTELSKGPKNRDLRSIMDVIIDVGEKGVNAARTFVSDCDTAGGAFVHPQISALVKSYQTCDFTELDDLSEEVRIAILNNFRFNKNLESETEERFGKMAMTVALMEDGLVLEFQKRSQALMKG